MKHETIRIKTWRYPQGHPNTIVLKWTCWTLVQAAFSAGKVSQFGSLFVKLSIWASSATFTELIVHSLHYKSAIAPTEVYRNCKGSRADEEQKTNCKNAANHSRAKFWECAWCFLNPIYSFRYKSFTHLHCTLQYPLLYCCTYNTYSPISDCPSRTVPGPPGNHNQLGVHTGLYLEGARIFSPEFSGFFSRQN